MELKNLTLEERDGIATVTLNRPEKLNAIDYQMRVDFRNLSWELAHRDEIRLVIFRGAGKAFSVGADLEGLGAEWTPKSFRAHSRILTQFFDDLEALEKPVIAAINGVCVGAGLELALSCDIRVASEEARLGFPENNIGLIPGVGGCSRLARFVGLGRAKDLILTGELISAQEAKEMGLVSYVVEADRLMPKVQEISERLLSRAPLALGLAKRAISTCMGIDMHSGRVIEGLAQSQLVVTEDKREGIRAFKAKEKPRFKGR